jgi:hypothetical protein
MPFPPAPKPSTAQFSPLKPTKPPKPARNKALVMPKPASAPGARKAPPPSSFGLLRSKEK